MLETSRFPEKYTYKILEARLSHVHVHNDLSGRVMEWGSHSQTDTQNAPDCAPQGLGKTMATPFPRYTLPDIFNC